MILTCPDCATRYFVGDDAVPPQGRIVRCAGCAAEWRALPEGPAEAPLTLAPEPEPVVEKPDPVSTVIRAKQKAKKQTQAAAAAGVVWAGLGVALASLVALALLFRVDVVRLWPRTAGAYAAIRMPVNPTGLSPENVQGGPGLQNGRAVMVVTGSLRNVTSGPRPAAPVTVSLFDKAGRRLVAQMVRPVGGAIAPGESRAFQATFLDPPLAAAEFGVDFAFEAPPRPHPAAPAAHGHGVLVHAAEGPAPQEPPPAPPSHAEAAAQAHAPEAQPLPADSPYALDHGTHG